VADNSPTARIRSPKSSERADVCLWTAFRHEEGYKGVILDAGAVGQLLAGGRGTSLLAVDPGPSREADPVNIHTILRLYSAGIHHAAALRVSLAVAARLAASPDRSIRPRRR
jgi:hypothetical protein